MYKVSLCRHNMKCHVLIINSEKILQRSNSSGEKQPSEPKQRKQRLVLRLEVKGPQEKKSKQVYRMLNCEGKIRTGTHYGQEVAKKQNLTNILHYSCLGCLSSKLIKKSQRPISVLHLLNCICYRLNTPETLSYNAALDHVGAGMHHSVQAYTEKLRQLQQKFGHCPQKIKPTYRVNILYLMGPGHTHTHTQIELYKQ